MTPNTHCFDAIRILNWEKWYEVNSSGRPWQLGQRLRQEPLRYCREPDRVTTRFYYNAISLLRDRCGSGLEHAAAEGIYGRMRSIASGHREDAAAKEPQRRGWVISENSDAYTLEMASQEWGMSETDIARLWKVLLEVKLIAVESCGWAQTGDVQLLEHIHSYASGLNAIAAEHKPLSVIQLDTFENPMESVTDTNVNEDTRCADLPMPESGVSESHIVGVVSDFYDKMRSRFDLGEVDPESASPRLILEDVSQKPLHAKMQIIDRAYLWCEKLVPSIRPSVTSHPEICQQALSDRTSLKNRLEEAWEIGGQELVVDLVALMQKKKKDFDASRGRIKNLIAFWQAGAKKLIESWEADERDEPED